MYSYPIEEFRLTYYRLFDGYDLDTTYVRYDGHTARNKYLYEAWNYGIEQEWIRTVFVELEQETFYKGYITEKGKQEILGV